RFDSSVCGQDLRKKAGQTCGSANQENMMFKLGFTVAAVLSLAVVIAAPACANDVQTTKGHQSKRHFPAAPNSAIAYGDPNLPVENALRWGYSQGYSNYPSG